MAGTFQYSDRIEFPEGSGPSSPPSNYLSLYAKTDDNFYLKNSAGVERPLFAYTVGSGLEIWNSTIEVTPDVARYSQAGTFAATNTFTAGQRFWGTTNPTAQLQVGIAGNTGGQIVMAINGNAAALTLSGSTKSIILDGTAGTTDFFNIRNFGISRWLFRNNFDAAVDTNDGTNTGANFVIMSRNDDGTLLDNPFLAFYRGMKNLNFRTSASGVDGSGMFMLGNMVRLPTGSPVNSVAVMSSGGSFMYRNSNGNQRYVVGVESIIKTTAAAPYTNDGYVTMYIGNNTAIKVMTTA